MSDRAEFESMVHHIGQRPASLSWGKRFRRFWEDLFEPRALRLVEAELLNVRLEKNRQIEALRAENSELKAKIEKLELAVWPLSSRAGQSYVASMTPPTAPLKISQPRSTWEQLVQQRIEENQRLDQEEAAQKQAKEN